MRYIALPSKSKYLVRDLATSQVVSVHATRQQANTEAKRRNAEYARTLHELITANA